MDNAIRSTAPHYPGARSLSLILQVKTGSKAGQKIECRSGQEIIIGRVPDRAQFAIPDDSSMSSVHFSVECGVTGCRIIDRKSTNGTYLNGKRIEQAPLSNGDQIRSGQTVFLAAILSDGSTGSQPAPPPIPRPTPIPDPAINTQKVPRFQIGGWLFAHVPADWDIKEGVGMVHKVPGGGFQSNITVSEERLNGITLEAYVEAQIKMIKEYLKDPKIEPAVPPKITGAEGSVGVQVNYSTREGQTVYIHRIYTRTGPSVGVASLTTLEGELRSALETFESVLCQAAFRPQQ